MNYVIKKKLSDIIKFVRRKVYKRSWVNLRNVNPISDDFGWSRGKPIDRFYIEKFLTNIFSLYVLLNLVSPATVGTPIQFP